MREGEGNSSLKVSRCVNIKVMEGGSFVKEWEKQLSKYCGESGKNNLCNPFQKTMTNNLENSENGTVVLAGIQKTNLKPL